MKVRGGSAGRGSGGVLCSGSGLRSGLLGDDAAGRRGRGSEEEALQGP